MKSPLRQQRHSISKRGKPLFHSVETLNKWKSKYRFLCLIELPYPMHYEWYFAFLLRNIRLSLVIFYFMARKHLLQIFTERECWNISRLLGGKIPLLFINPIMLVYRKFYWTTLISNRAITKRKSHVKYKCFEWISSFIFRMFAYKRSLSSFSQLVFLTTVFLFVHFGNKQIPFLNQLMLSIIN